MRQALEAVDWTQSLQGDANIQWTTFSSITRQLEKKYISCRKLLKG